MQQLHSRLARTWALFRRRTSFHGRTLALAALTAGLTHPAARAQAPTYTDATIGSTVQNSGTSWTRAIATDAAGNVYITGSLGGQVTFGSTVLTSAGSDDIFIAKYVPGTGTWAWAVRGGGTGADSGQGIAVVGNNVYVTGLLHNDAADSRSVRFDTGAGTATVTQPGASSANEYDIIVAKYTDNGTSASLGWLQVAGGTGVDIGYDLAASGNSVYVSGVITNNTADTNLVRFGRTGSTAGTLAQPGASATSSRDLVVAKYTDNGTSASVSWVQVAGGTSADQGTSVAVDGTGVFVAGHITNSLTDANSVRFGGTAVQAGAYGNSTGTRDIVVARYTDNGATASFDWSQVGGGSAGDEAFGIAASGGNVYITGAITNRTNDFNAVRFGGSGTTAGTAVQLGTNNATNPNGDIVVAKYTDNGTSATFGWSQVGGGTQTEQGNGIVVSGNSVYVAGVTNNTSANTNAVMFGGSGTTLASVPRPGASSVYSGDAVVAKYTDLGTSATLDWTQVGGGSGVEAGYDIALHGSTLYLGGQTTPTSTGFNFGAANTATLEGTRAVRALISSLATTDGSWQALASPTHGGTSFTRAVATDAAGNVFVTGYFTGRVAFGNTVLVADGLGTNSTGANDLFVAKYVPGTSTWAWALSGGGTGSDGGNAIAVSGSSVYVTGSFFNSLTDANQVRFGGSGGAGAVQVNGNNQNSSESSADLIVLKFTDLGTSATLDWNQVGGGYSNDQGHAIAVSGNSVYVTGHINNTLTDVAKVRFGGSGTTLGTTQVNGASTRFYGYTTDMVLAKYTDNGSSATLNWAQSGGGKETDAGYGLAISGTNVYVTGHITNNLSDLNVVRFGGSAQQNGASTNGAINNDGTGSDLFVAKYTDTGSFVWSQVAGGTSTDIGYGVAVSGTSVYVTGFVTNSSTDGNAVRFGGSGTTAGTRVQAGASTSASQDLVLARYTDNGPSATLDWTQVGGGTGADLGYGVVVDGTDVYVSGGITNSSTDANAVRFGGSGTTAGTSAQAGASTSASKDVVVAKYADAGTAATVTWTRADGGPNSDESYGLALRGDNLYPVGTAVPTARFGSFVFTTPAAGQTDFLGELPTVFTPLPVKLTAFTATAEGRAARLHWTTASEKNNAWFAIERSPDGREFAQVGQLPGQGTKAAPTSYTYLDKQLPAGTVYYRLRQADLDGTSSYSPVRSVTTKADPLTVTFAVYPTPAGPGQPLRYAYTGPALPADATLEVLDATGRRLSRQSINSAATGLLAPTGLTSGWYWLRLQGTPVVRPVRFYQP